MSDRIERMHKRMRRLRDEGQNGEVLPSARSGLSYGTGTKKQEHEKLEARTSGK